MAEIEDRTAIWRSNLGWLLLVVGVALAVWTISRGFGTIALIFGVPMIVSSLVLGIVAAPRLSRFERGWWMATIALAAFVGTLLLAVLIFPWDSVCNPPGTSLTDDLNCRAGWTIVVLASAIGVSAASLIAFSRWSRSRQAKHPALRSSA